MNANRTLKLTTLALCGVINILGGTVALLLRLPVYLDSIGTVLAAALFGPVAGLVPGLISGLISGMTSDVYAFYYIPVQLILALIALLLFIPVFHEYVMTGLVPKLPTLVTSGFFMVSAVVALGIGLVLDTEVKNSRKNLEIQMNIIQMMLKK